MNLQISTKLATRQIQADSLPGHAVIRWHA